MPASKRPESQHIRTSLIDTEWDSPEVVPAGRVPELQPELGEYDDQTVQIGAEQLQSLTSYTESIHDHDTQVTELDPMADKDGRDFDYDQTVDALLESEEERRLQSRPAPPRAEASVAVPAPPLARAPLPAPPFSQAPQAVPRAPADAGRPAFGAGAEPARPSPPGEAPVEVEPDPVPAPLHSPPQYAPPSRPPQAHEPPTSPTSLRVETSALSPQASPSGDRTWLIVALVTPLALGAGIAIGKWGLGSEPSVASPAPETTAAPEAPPAEPEPRELDVVERAAAGDHEALEELEERDPAERASKETLAIAQGRSHNKALALRGFGAEIEKTPDLLSDKDQLTRLKDFFYDRETTNQAARLIADLPGPLGPDLLYDLWVGTKRRDESTMLAEALVYATDVREKASPALKVALDLRKLEECEPIKELLPRAAEAGDRRSLHLLGRLQQKIGCGPSKRDDCWECLRPLDDDEEAVSLVDAIRAVRKRAGPKL